MASPRGKHVPIIIIICISILAKQVSSGKLLMFLLDGFRWDYLDIHGPLETLPGFQRLVASGVKTDYMKPCFPSESLVNYYSLTTGLYPESHGIVSNRIHDSDRDADLVLFQLPNLRWKFWWDAAEPIWINVERNSKHAHMYYWEGCEIELEGFKATFCIPFQEPPWSTLQNSVYQGIHALSEDTAELIGIYIGHIDTEGHHSGPNSKEIKEGVHHIDDIIRYAQDELVKQGLNDKVDVMVFSDHGMAETNFDRIINITNYIDFNDIQTLAHEGCMMELWPKPGKLDKIYSALDGAHPHMRPYLHKDIPERWHLKNNQRTPDILLLADVGWYVVYDTPGYYTQKGGHGYDNNETDMRSIFLATGPHFQNGKTLAPVDAVDIYQLMCHVLDLEPRPHNGSWGHVQDMLIDLNTVYQRGQEPPNEAGTFDNIFNLVNKIIGYIC